MKKSKQKYYVVISGRCPGVYNSWNECKAQTNKFPGARHKSFKCLDAVNDFLKINRIWLVDPYPLRENGEVSLFFSLEPKCCFAMTVKRTLSLLASLSGMGCISSCPALPSVSGYQSGSLSACLQISLSAPAVVSWGSVTSRKKKLLRKL